jgi:uncharacterized membrane protein
MEKRRAHLMVASLVLASLISGILLRERMPDTMASHWGLRGEANGSMSRDLALFMLPAMTAFFSALMFVIPRFDPLRSNVEKFMGHYALFIVSFAAFLTYLHALTLAWNLGLGFDMMRWLAPAFSLFMWQVAALMRHTERNWFIGIRTPWTISSDAVWKRTHEMGSRLFRISSLICLLGVLVPGSFIILLLASILPSTFYVVLYSYIEYRKEPKP